MVTVDFIGAEYNSTDQKGFKKRMPADYSGGIAKAGTTKNSDYDAQSLNCGRNKGSSEIGGD